MYDKILMAIDHSEISDRALAAAHATVSELPGSSADAAVWFHDDPAQAAPAIHAL